MHKIPTCHKNEPVHISASANNWIVCKSKRQIFSGRMHRIPEYQVSGVFLEVWKKNYIVISHQILIKSKKYFPSVLVLHPGIRHCGKVDGPMSDLPSFVPRYCIDRDKIMLDSFRDAGSISGDWKSTPPSNLRIPAPGDRRKKWVIFLALENFVCWAMCGGKYYLRERGCSPGGSS